MGKSAAVWISALPNWPNWMRGIVVFSGRIVFNATNLDGTLLKLTDVGKLHSLR